MTTVPRLRGFIKETHPGSEGSGFGIIIDGYGVQYMFLPSYMRRPNLFLQLTPHTEVEFKPFKHARGMRAGNIDVHRLHPKPEPVRVTADGENPTV